MRGARWGLEYLDLPRDVSVSVASCQSAPDAAAAVVDSNLGVFASRSMGVE